ncbi:MAG: hypothetical protein K0R49_1415 [Burkholderiales bacterium]|jgi:hypothetical protein|nr:hypothetical protein [Burkholderiales bacterium]
MKKIILLSGLISVLCVPLSVLANGSNDLLKPFLSSFTVFPAGRIFSVSNVNQGSDITKSCVVMDAKDYTQPIDPSKYYSSNDCTYSAISSDTIDSSFRLFGKYIAAKVSRGSEVVYSDPVFSQNPWPIAEQPASTLVYSDSEKFNVRVDNYNSQAQATYNCVYSDVKNPEPNQYKDIDCAIDKTDSGLNATVTWADVPADMKGKYFGIKAVTKLYEKNGYFNSTPVTSLPANMLGLEPLASCAPPTVADFSNSSITKQSGSFLKLQFSFRSNRTLKTSPDDYDYNNQKPAKLVTTPGADYTYTTVDSSIPINDPTPIFAYKIYNICENGVKSDTYYTLQINRKGEIVSK